MLTKRKINMTSVLVILRCNENISNVWFDTAIICLYNDNVNIRTYLYDTNGIHRAWVFFAERKPQHGYGIACRNSGLGRQQQSGGEGMQKKNVLEAASAFQDDDSDSGVSYGCVFCLTGKEKQVAEIIQLACPEAKAITMRKTRYRTCHKVKTLEEVIVMPSYVFFKAPSQAEPLAQFPRQDVIRILTTDKGEWRLTGADEQFVKWLFHYDGLLGLSQAFKEGDRIRIVSGPLKDMEGKITRVDKRGCSGQVVLTFNGKDVPVWLSFEMINTL